MCPKCRSCVLIEEITSDPEDGRAVYLIRCPICGWYSDSVMEKNKRAPITDPKDLAPQGQQPRSDADYE